MVFKKNPQKLIESLQRFCFFIGEGYPTPDEMLKVISKARKDCLDSDSYELEYWLGTALVYYNTWFVRGDERKPYLEEAVYHLERAFALSEGKIPKEYPPHEVKEFGSLFRNDIACEVGQLLIDEAIIRDIEKGISYLRPVFESSSYYHPLLCFYAETYYKLEDYLKAAEVALELHKRAEKEWKDKAPPAPLGIVAKSYRAQAKQHKKNGEIDQAIYYFQKLVDMDLATDNDQKLLKKLQESLGKT